MRRQKPGARRQDSIEYIVCSKEEKDKEWKELAGSSTIMLFL